MKAAAFLHSVRSAKNLCLYLYPLGHHDLITTLSLLEHMELRVQHGETVNELHVKMMEHMEMMLQERKRSMESPKPMEMERI